MTEIPHTPTPWKVHDNGHYIEILPEEWSEGIPCSIGNVCSSYPSDKDQGLQMANAEHIVNCVNLHDQLIEALYRLKTECEFDGVQNKAGYAHWIKMANEVLAKAGVF